MFGYLKKTQIEELCSTLVINFSHILDNMQKIRPNFLHDHPDADEEIDKHFPQAFGRLLQYSICCNTDHAYDRMTIHSITGIIGYIGRTPVLWIARYQGAIATSTYSAKFIALYTVTEEAISLQYTLRYLGVPITSDSSAPTRIFGDNLSVIQREGDVMTKQITAKEFLTHIENICWSAPHRN